MFSVTDFDAERFHCHQTPKHLAEDVVDMVFPAMTMERLLRVLLPLTLKHLT